jgi:hypothetical protein
VEVPVPDLYVDPEILLFPCRDQIQEAFLFDAA